MTQGALLARFVRSVCLWHALLLPDVISFKSGYSPFAFEFYWFVKSAPFTSCLYIKNVGTEEGNCTRWERQRIKGFDNGIFSNHLKHDISVWFYQLPKTNWPICQQLKSALTIYLSTENQQGGMSLSTSGGRMTGSLVKLSCREQRVSIL